MIPGKIFTSLAKFQGIVSVNDLRLPIRIQELLQAPSDFLRSFCFARIRLDPLGDQVLHHDCTSMIVSRFTSFTDKFVIGCNQITKNFCTRFAATSAYPESNFSKVLKMVHEKNSRVNLDVQELFHPQDSL